MSLEAALAANTAALEKNNEYLARVVAGQQQALDTIAAKGSKKAAAEAEVTSAKPEKKTEVAEKPAKAEAKKSKGELSFTTEELVAEATAYLKATNDPEERDKRKGQLAKIATNFQSGTLSKLTDPDEIKAAVYFVRCFVKGLPVNFKADYDFNTDPREAEAPDDEI
jgi:hypothetical protein